MVLMIRPDFYSSSLYHSAIRYAAAATLFMHDKCMHTQLLIFVYTQLLIFVHTQLLISLLAQLLLSVEGRLKTVHARSKGRVKCT